MSRTKEELLVASDQIRRETQQSANSAERVGSVLYDITEHLGEGGGASDNYLNATYQEEGKVAIATYKIGNNSSGTLYAPGGGGGGSADPRKIGTQISYYLNLTKGTTPATPSIGDWNHQTSSSGDQFVHVTSSGNQVWKRIDENKQTTEDTWQIWVWFENNTPQYINGPVNMTAGGTNGADSNEREFIYFRTPNELVDDAITQLSNYFTGCVGTAEAKNGWTFEHEDAIPKDALGYSFTDQAQGIDDNQNKYEYEAYRDSTLVNGSRTWGTDCFHGPYLRSAYGKKGQDGDGVEYIYYASTSSPVGNLSHPETWMTNYPQYTDGQGTVHTYQEDEYIVPNSGWADEPVDLDDPNYGPGYRQWVSIRKSQDNVWQSYSEPKLWSGVGADGVVDGYLVSTSNPSILVTTDSTGLIASFEDECLFEVFHNSSRVEYSQQATSNYYSLTVNAANIRRSDGGIVNGINVTSEKKGVNGNIRVSLNNVTNMDNTTITVPVIVNLPGSSGTRTYDIKVVGIPASEGGIAIDLYTNTNVIRTDYYEQNAVPSTVNIGVRYGSDIYYSGDLSESAESKGYTFKYYYDNGLTPTKQTASGPITVQPNGVSLVVEMYKDGNFMEDKVIPFVKDGAPGIGIDAVNYSIAVLSTSVAVDNNQVAGAINFKVLKTVGATTTEITTDTEQDDINIGATINGNTATPSYSIDHWSIEQNSANYDSSYPFSQIYVESVPHSILASTTIPIIKNGSSSPVQGLDAVVMRFRSYAAIISGNTDECGDGYGNIQNGRLPGTDGVVYMDVVLFDGAQGDNEYYRVAETNTATRNRIWAVNNPPVVNGSVGAAWVKFNRTADAAFTALLAKYAYIENLTAAEIVITDSQQNPVAGMTRGSGAGIYPSGGNPIADNKRGDVRIWAGYSGGTANLYDSKFYVTEDGFVHIEDADIKNTLRYHKLLKSTPSASAINLFDIVDNKLELLCDTFLLYGTYSSNAVIQLPPASFFAGASIRIINGTYRSNSGHLDGDPSIVTLEVYHSSNTEPSYEDSQLVSMNSLAIATPFSFAGSSSQAYYDYYTTISFDSYTSVELIAAENWYQSNPYYVWMVVDAR